MKKNTDWLMIALYIVLIPLVLLIGAIVWMAIWTWIVPDVFAGMVAAGYLPMYLTLGQAFKLMIGTAFLFTGFKSSQK